MSCCDCTATGRMFTRGAERSARKYRKRGLDAAQRALHAALTAEGVRECSVLEIGCGVGGLQIELLRSGARSALGMDVSAGMITQAEKLAHAAGFSAMATYRTADFLQAAEGVPEADVVLLDKVLCCSPDAVGLIRKSAEKARTLYAVSFPRDGFIAKVAFTIPYTLGRLLRWSFYPFYHDPAMLEATIASSGLRAVARATTPVWQIAVYRRVAADGTTTGMFSAG